MATTLSGLGTRRRARRGFAILPMLSSLMVIGAVTLFGLQLVQFSQQQERLPEDLTVAGVDVGGMVPVEALSTWEQVYASPVVLYYGDSPILLDPSSVGFRTSQETMLSAARSANTGGSGFWGRFYNFLLQRESRTITDVPLAADYQQGLLRQFLQDVAARYDRRPGQTDYDLVTLTFANGGEGAILDVERALRDVERALFSPTERTVVLPVNPVEASAGGLTALRGMLIDYLNAQNFIYDGQTTIAAIYILDLQTGEEINIMGDVAFSAASTMKLPIMVQYYRGLSFAPSQEEAWLMANSLLCSNNSSSNLLMQLIGDGNLFAGLGEINTTMQGLGVRNTFITAPYDLGIEGQQLGSIAPPVTEPNPNYNTNPDPFNQTTAEDMGTLFSLVYDCAYYGSGLMAAYPDQFTQGECRQMLELMSGNDLLRLLQGGVPEGTRISHKNGWIYDTVGEAGVVFSPNGRHYVISVFLWEQIPDGALQNYEQLWPIMEEVSRATWNYFNPEAQMLERRADLPVTAQECEGNYLPPDMASVNLDDIDAWRTQPGNASS